MTAPNMTTMPMHVIRSAKEKLDTSGAAASYVSRANTLSLPTFSVFPLCTARSRTMLFLKRTIRVSGRLTSVLPVSVRMNGTVLTKNVLPGRASIKAASFPNIPGSILVSRGL